jgi:hypothetical protein
VRSRSSFRYVNQAVDRVIKTFLVICEHWASINMLSSTHSYLTIVSQSNWVYIINFTEKKCAEIFSGDHLCQYEYFRDVMCHHHHCRRLMIDPDDGDLLSVRFLTQYWHCWCLDKISVHPQILFKIYFNIIDINLRIFSSGLHIFEFENIILKVCLWFASYTICYPALLIISQS